MQYPQWLIDFFQFNKIQFQAIVDQRYQEPRKSLFNEFLSPIKQQQRYFALPYVHENGEVQIYVGGVDKERDLAELIILLKNALSTSYINHYEVIHQSVEDDYATNVLLAQFPIGIVCLSYYPKLSGDEILQGFQLINRLIQILNRRPYLVDLVKRPVGRILRDFYLAKENGDIDMLQSCFEEIKASSSLGAKNLIFLEIQTLAYTEQWQEIIQHPQLKHLIDGLMPPCLLQNILAALGQVGGDQFLLSPLEATVDVQVLQKEYQKFTPIFTRLLELPKDPKYIRQWQQWVIGSSLLGQYQYFEQLPKFIDMQWCGQVVQKIKDHGYFIERREDKHFGLKLTVPQSLEQVRVYINYCVNLAPEDWSDIWFYLEKIPLEIRSYLEKDPNLKEKWERIEAYCGKKIFYEWNNWFDQLIHDQQVDAEKILIKLHNEYQIWTVKSFVESQLVKILHINEERINEVLRDALPIMLEWLSENQVDLSIETVLMLFILLVDDEKNDPNDLQLFYELLIYWKKLRNNQHYDHQVVMSLELLLKKCQLNSLYHLPLYQRRVVQIVEVFKTVEDIKNIDIQLLETFIQI